MQLIVEKRNPTQTVVQADQVTTMQFKISDKSVTFFAPGMSTAVLWLLLNVVFKQNPKHIRVHFLFPCYQASVSCVIAACITLKVKMKNWELSIPWWKCQSSEYWWTMHFLCIIEYICWNWINCSNSNFDILYIIMYNNMNKITQLPLLANGIISFSQLSQSKHLLATQQIIISHACTFLWFPCVLILSPFHYFSASFVIFAFVFICLILAIKVSELFSVGFHKTNKLLFFL